MVQTAVVEFGLALVATSSVALVATARRESALLWACVAALLCTSTFVLLPIPYVRVLAGAAVSADALARMSARRMQAREGARSGRTTM